MLRRRFTRRVHANAFSTLPHDVVVDRLRFVCETVEQRVLLSMPDLDLIGPIPAFDWDIEHRESARLATENGPEATSIVWTNRGLASDNFAAVFGTSANAARNVVDAALNSWERVITNWNRSDGTTTLQINIAITGDGFGAAAGPDAIAPADGKPRTGAITIGRGNLSADPNDSNGWFLDPTPMDNSEFLGSLDSAFCGTAASPVGPDLFSVVIHETSHVLGMISDPNNAGGSWQGYRLENFVTNTGIRDNAEGGGLYGHFYAFSGGSVDHAMTSYNSGNATSASWGNVVHTAGSGANFNWNGQNWRGAEDVGNAIYNYDQRIPPDWVLSHTLADAYGYTIVDPNTFGTFYATLIQNTGELRVRGATGSLNSGDVIVVSSSGSQITVSVDAGVDTPGTGVLSGAGNLAAWVSTFNAADVSSIRIYGGDGVDAIRVEGNAGKPVYACGEAGDDYLDLSYYAGNLGNITGAVSMYGGGGNDTMWMYDDFISTPLTYSIDSAYVNRPGFGGAYYGSDVEGLTVATTSSADTVNVASTYYATPLTIRTSGGQDTVNLGNPTDGVQSIDANVWIENTNSFSQLNISDDGDGVGRTATMSNDGTWGRITGLAPAGIYWKQADVNNVNVTLSDYADTFNLLRTTEGVAINGNSGSDTINIGEANSTANIGGGGITLRNAYSFNTVNVSNSGRNTPQTVSLARGDLDGVIFGILSGLAAATITYRYGDTSDVNISLGSGADTLNVLATGGIGVTAVDGTGGADVVTVGDAGNLEYLATRLVLRNTSSYSTLTIDDSTDATTDNVAVLPFVDGTGTYARVTGMAPAAIDYRLNDVADVTLKTGTAGDSVQIGITGGIGATTLVSAGGADSVRVGGLAAVGAQQILLPLYISNPPSFTSLVVDDMDDTVARNITLETTNISGTDYNRITGIAPAAIYMRVGDFSSPARIEAGSGGDTFRIRATAGAPSFNLLGHGGNDVFLMGDATNKVDPLNSATTVDGGPGSNTLTFNDQGNGAAQGFTVTATTVAHPAMGTVTYSNLDRVTVNGTGVAATHTVSGTAPTTNVAVNTGPGADTVLVTETALGSGVSIGGALAGDVVRVNADDLGVANAAFTGSTLLGVLEVGAGGFLTMQTGAGVLRTVGSMAVRGRVDLTNNGMVLDYSGADPTSTIAALLANGYNGGAWNGMQPAILSTTAASAAKPNDAVGYAKPIDIGSPGTWLGMPIDATSILVRYTLYGDADLDHSVDIGDFSLLAANFNQSLRRWSQGNFNYDALTGISDFSLLAANFNEVLPATLPGSEPVESRLAGLFSDMLILPESIAASVLGQ